MFICTLHCGFRYRLSNTYDTLLNWSWWCLRDKMIYGLHQSIRLKKDFTYIFMYRVFVSTEVSVLRVVMVDMSSMFTVRWTCL